MDRSDEARGLTHVYSFPAARVGAEIQPSCPATPARVAFRDLRHLREEVPSRKDADSTT